MWLTWEELSRISAVIVFSHIYDFNRSGWPLPDNRGLLF